MKESVGYSKKSAGTVAFETATIVSGIGGIAIFVGDKLLNPPVKEKKLKQVHEMKQTVEPSNEKTLASVSQLLADERKQREEAKGKALDWVVDVVFNFRMRFNFAHDLNISFSLA
ncbi:hypothetical protein ACET3Z_033061 [Daucus carota]